MKKFLVVLFAAVLFTVLAITASAELYSPGYYAALKVENGAITVDGAVDQAYGNPIFYFQADGTTDEAGDYTSPANWFFTGNKSGDTEDVLALLLIPENYVKGYAVWTDSALYVCIDTNILGWTPAENIENMWLASCVQLGIFDFKSGDNADWLMALNAEDEVLQSIGKQNQNAADKVYPFLKNDETTGQTDLNVKITREGDHVVYEAELPFVKTLSFVPQEGDSIGFDVCVDFGDGASVQNSLTFVQPGTEKGYHSRDIDFACPLYFVTDKADADEPYFEKICATEAKQDEHSIGLFGCNELPDGTDFLLEITHRKAGFASLFLNVSTLGGTPVSTNHFAIPAVDGTGYDTLEFWLELTDMEIFDLTEGQLVISSSGSADAQQIVWTLDQLQSVKKGGVSQGSDLKVGWNLVVLPLNTGDMADDFDISNINFIGLDIENDQLERASLTLDSFRLSDDQAVLEEEAKKAASKVDETIGKLADTITTDNYNALKIKVRSARTAYDKLTELEKSFVDAAMLEKLQTLEQGLETFDPDADEPADTPDDPTDTPDTPVVKPPVSNPTQPESDNTLWIIIAAVAVVVIGGVVALVILKKKKA